MCLKSLAAGHAVRIRIENTESLDERVSIRAVNKAAFGGSDEADLVDKLRAEHAVLSLVAELEGDIVGHIMFSRMWIRNLICGHAVPEGRRKSRPTPERSPMVAGLSAIRKLGRRYS